MWLSCKDVKVGFKHWETKPCENEPWVNVAIFCTVVQKMGIWGEKNPNKPCFLLAFVFVHIVFKLQANKNFPLESHSEIDT